MRTHAPTQNGANAPRSSTASLSRVIALLSCTGTRACAIGPCPAGPGAPSHARTPCLLVPSSADLGSSVGHRIASKRRRGGSSCNLNTIFGHFKVQHGGTTFFAAMHFVLHSTSLARGCAAPRRWLTTKHLATDRGCCSRREPREGRTRMQKRSRTRGCCICSAPHPR